MRILIFLILFLVGIFIHFIVFSRFWLIRPRKKAINDLLISIFCALFLSGLIATKLSPYNAIFHLGFFNIFIAFFLAWGFRKEILPIINEQSILQTTILFDFYIIIFSIAKFKQLTSNPLLMILLLIVLLITVDVAVVSIRNYVLTFGHKLLLYCWFLLVSLLLGTPNFLIVIMNVKHAIIDNHANLDLLDSFLSGMFFFYTISLITYIVKLIPLPSKHQRIKDRMEELEKYTKLLVSKYDNTQLRFKQTIFIIVCQLVILCANFYLNLVKASVIIYIPMLLIQIFVTYQKPAKIKINSEA